MIKKSILLSVPLLISSIVQAGQADPVSMDIKKMESSVQSKELEYNPSNQYRNHKNNGVINAMPVSTTALNSQVYGLNPYTGIQAKKLKFGQVSFVPTLNVEVGHNNNLGLNNTSKDSSLASLLSPNLSASIDKGAHKYAISYAGKIYRYPSSKVDNRENHNLKFTALNGFTRKSNLTWSLQYTDGSEERGFRDDSRIANLRSPNEFDSYSANIKYVYGATNAKGNIELSAGYLDKTYTKNREVTAFGDINTINYASKFNYRVAPKTFLSFALRQAITDHKLSTAIQDNTTTRKTIGFRWNAYTKTQIYLNIGNEKRNFKNKVVDDRSTSFHQVGLYWSPKYYSTLELYSGRGMVDGSISTITNGQSTGYGFNWRHAWNKRFTSVLNYNDTKINYFGSAPRTDKIRAYGGQLNYRYSGNKEFNLKYNAVNRGSTDSDLGYDLNILMIGMNISL